MRPPGYGQSVTRGHLVRARPALSVRCPLCEVTAASSIALAMHVEAAHFEQPGPGRIAGFRRSADTTRGRIVVPVRIDHDLRVLLDLVIALADRGHLTVDLVAVPTGADTRALCSVLRAMSEAASCRGVPSARWRLLEPGLPVQRILADLDREPPDLVCLPAARPGEVWAGAGDVAGELVRRSPVAMLLIGPGAVPVLSVPPVPPVLLRSIVDEPYGEIGRRCDELVRRLGLTVYRRPCSVEPERELVLHVPVS